MSAGLFAGDVAMIACAADARRGSNIPSRSAPHVADGMKDRFLADLSSRHGRRRRRSDQRFDECQRPLTVNGGELFVTNSTSGIFQPGEYRLINYSGTTPGGTGQITVGTLARQGARRGVCGITLAAPSCDRSGIRSRVGFALSPNPPDFWPEMKTQRGASLPRC